ncbi:MAG: hypothetical protein P4K86_06255 [Terracidiphilus sp.]|nr:hypothetical protein [Terracidiphilus sp.]MDR3777065.1 hypothetical protein [Terracidiphilus sp.]
MCDEEATNQTQEGLEESKLLDKIEKWRIRRAQLLEQGKGPAPVAGKILASFHAIPAGALTRRLLSESWSVPEQNKLQIYVPHQATNYFYNAEGFLAVAGYSKDSCSGYTQLFRSGMLEYVDYDCSGRIGNGTEPMVFGQSIEQLFVHCYEDAKQTLQMMGNTEPVYIGFTLIGIDSKRFYSTYTRSVFSDVMARPKQNVFISPEVLADFASDEPSPYGHTLLPLINTMWQVAGSKETPFQMNHEWTPFHEYH